MISVKADYSQRKEEINEYFSFLTIIDDDEHTTLSYKKDGEMISEIISTELLKILIANGFVLLYNVIEATIRNCICEIYDRIHDADVSYSILHKNIQKIWIDQNTSALREGTFRIDTLRNCVIEIADSVVNSKPILLAKDKMEFSGNLDAGQIRGLATKYGFKQPTKNGDRLVTIKNKRNHLAHGDSTFSNVGKDYSVSELVSIKDETISFLDDVLEKIEEYIDSRGFQVLAGA